MRRQWCPTIAAALLLTCSSCGNSHNLYPVSGKVTYKGAAAVGATVFLQRQGGDPLKEQTIMGIVGEDGTFTLVCGPHGQGAPPGEYDVLIEWKDGSNRAKGLAQKVPDRLRGRYANVKHPLLHAVIKAETNSLPPYELVD